MTRELSALLLIIFNELMKNEKLYEKEVQIALLEALNAMRGEMQSIYDKYAKNGVLTITEMSKYNRYANMENQMMGILDPVLVQNVLTIRDFLPEQYKEAFYRNGWALDINTGVHLGLTIVRKETLTELFSITNAKNMYMAESLNNYSMDARRKIRQALMNGLSLGKSPMSMSRDLKKAIDVTYSKALTIIRTEGMRALNAGMHDSNLKALVNGVDGKIMWQSTLDDKTRPVNKWAKGDHREMDGQYLGDDGLFHLHFTHETAPYPCWEGLSAGQRINCRCHEVMVIKGLKPELRRTRDQGVIPYEDYKSWRKHYYPNEK